MPEDNATPTNERPYNASTTPKDLKVKIKEQLLLVDWSDGTNSEFSLDWLRQHCPCALCREERGKRDDNPLRILKFDPTKVRVTSAQLVGTYAIKFVWSDGHDTGIFDFRYLRELEAGKDSA